jgi:hypothetical protein
VNGQARNKVAQVDSDGCSNTWNSGSGVAGGDVNALSVQDDQNIIIAGSFTSLDGVQRNRIARLLP